MLCVHCGKENSEQRTYCSACGETIRGGGSHFSRKFCRLIGSIGGVRASLELVITDQTFVAGELSLEEAKQHMNMSKVANDDIILCFSHPLI